MTANQAVYPIETMAQRLGVSRSGFYAWSSRSPSTRAMAGGDLIQRIRKIHAASREIYEAPRIHAGLAETGIPVGRKRVERLMKAAGLKGVSRRRGTRTTIRDEPLRPASVLVDRNSYTHEPNMLWIADITLSN
jgi:putative transposase